MDHTTKINIKHNNNNILIIKTKIYKNKKIISISEMSLKEFRNNSINEKMKIKTKKTIKMIKRKKK